MTSEVWVELWTRPGDPDFGRRRDYLPYRSAGAHVGINRVGEGNLELPDSFAGFNDILQTDSDTPSNSQSSLVRIYSAEDPTTPIAEWLPSEIFPGGDKDNPYTKVTGVGINGILGYARLEAFDWDGTDNFSCNECDWTYGGQNILGNPGFESSVCRPEINELTIDRTVVTGGTFTISDGVDTTDPIAYDASATAVELAMEADLAGIDDVLVSGGGGVGDPYIIETVDPCTQAGGFTFDGSGLTPSAGDSGLERTQFGVLVPDPWTKSQTVSRGVAKTFGVYDSFRVTAAEAHSGTWSLLIDPGAISSDADRYTGAQQVISVRPGTTYQAKVWIRPTSASDRFRFVIRGIDGDYVAGVVGGTTFTANTWNEWTIDDIDVGDRDQVIFRVANVNNPNLGHPSNPSIFYLDDAEFTPGQRPNTVGRILGDIYDHAVDATLRSTLIVWDDGSGTDTPYLTLDFTDAVDSNGNAWDDDEISTRLTMRQSYSQIMANLANEYGYEYRIVPNDAEAGTWLWQVFNPGGMDTSPDVAVQGGASDTRRQFRRQAPSGTDQLVEGLGRITSRARSTGLMNALGRIEASELSREATELSSVTSAASRAISEALQDISSVAYTLIDPQDEPLSDYGIGDTVTIVDPPDITAASKRFVDLEVSISGNAVEWECSYGALVVTNADAAVADAVAGLLTKFEYPDPEPEGGPVSIGGGGGTPTVVVAASDASDLSKSKADFVCAGVNDQDTIQAAIDQFVPSSPWQGVRILLTEGLFAINMANQSYEGIRMDYGTIQGMGSEATIINADSDPGVADNPLIYLATTRCTVRDLSLQGGGATRVTGIHSQSYQALIENVMFSTTGLAVMVDQDVQLIRSCSVEGDDGIEVQANHNEVYILGNDIQAAAGGSKCVELLGNNDHVIIANNHMLGVDGIVVAGSSHLEHVYANNVIRATQHGIHFDSAGIISAVVEGNTIAQTGSHSIYIDGGNHLTTLIRGNTIRWSDGEGIRVEADLQQGRITIDGNFIEDPDHHGIHFLTGGANGVSHSMVVNNYINQAGKGATNTYDGILVEDDSDYNYIVNNVIRSVDEDPQMRYAINIAATTCNCNIVVGNQLGDPTDYGTHALNDAGTDTQLTYPNDPVLGDNFGACPTSS